MTGVRAVIGAVLTGALAVVATACDTDDGTTLSSPGPTTTTLPSAVGSTTVAEVPPGDDAALSSVPITAGPDTGANEGTDATTLPATDDTGTDGTDGAADAFTLVGPWLDGAPIDVRHTCDGEDVAPALSWIDPPPGTVELAFSMVDDTTAPPGSDARPFVHWVLAGVDPAEISLVEGETPPGGILGLNFFGDVAYGGPCPPVDDPPHDYRIVAYALNQQTELADGTPATEFLDFLDAVAIETAELTGTYQR